MSRRPQTAIRWLIFATIICGVFFRFYHLDRKTFWEDEILDTIRMLGFTEAEIVRAAPHMRSAGDVQIYFGTRTSAGDAGRPLSATIRALAIEDPQHPPLYYLLVREWTEMAGTSVFALRTLPAFFGILAIGAMYWLALELFDSSGAAWCAAALYAISPLAILYSQEAREYTLWALIILASSALLVRAVRARLMGLWVCYCALLTLGLYVDPLMALVIAAHGVFLIAERTARTKAVLVPYVISAAFASLLYVPWLLVMNASVGMRGFAGMLSAKLSVTGLGVTFLRDLNLSLIDLGTSLAGPFRLASKVLGAAILALIVYAFWFFLRRAGSVARAFVCALFVVPVLPFLAHDLLSGGALVSQVRYLEPLYIAIPLALAFFFDIKSTEPSVSGSGGNTVWSAAFALTLLVGAVSCVLSAQARTWYNKAYERTPEVADLINRTQRPILIADTNTSRLLGLAFYLRSNVALRARLYCDQCVVEPPGADSSLSEPAGFANTFIMGRVRGAIPKVPGPFSTIGVQTFPDESGPLDMFRSVYAEPVR